MSRPADAAALQANQLGALWATLEQAVSRGFGEESASTAAALLTMLHWTELRVVALAGILGLSQPATTRLVDALVARGLARRTAISGREVRVGLTGSGRRHANALQQRREEVLTQLLQALDAPERAEFERLVSKILVAPVTDRAYARHVCRFCHHGVCTGAACSIGTRASAMERDAGIDPDAWRRAGGDGIA